LVPAFLLIRISLKKKELPEEEIISSNNQTVESVSHPDVENVEILPSTSNASMILSGLLLLSCKPCSGRDTRWEHVNWAGC
jgi:hypothetical protein